MRSEWCGIIVLLTGLAASAQAESKQDRASFDDHFTAKTMRVDYFHTGTRSEEHVALDRITSDGDWPGSRTHLIDSLNLGKYRFEVYDQKNQQLLFSRGFSSIYGEWETTAEAKSRWGAFHETLRFPWPRKPVRVELKKRSADNTSWSHVWTRKVDPDSRIVNSADPPARGKRWTIMEHGPPAEKVDVVFLGDGYTTAELGDFRERARHLAKALFAEEPFRTRKTSFNVWAVDSPSAKSGVSRPHAGVFRHPRISTQYSIFDSERYVLTKDNRTLRDVASTAPYDFLVILVNERTYGGGGIFRDQTTLAARSGFADYLMIHEFGHHFAGLGDEYYTSDVAYEQDEKLPEPWRPNLTALHDPQKLKWRDLVEEKTPIPTPWNKEAFETVSQGIQKERKRLRAEKAPEEKLEALFRDERARMTRLLGASEFAKQIGAFEGGGYRAKGLYRPSADCIMFTRDRVGFCPICRRAIERVIDQYSQ